MGVQLMVSGKVNKKNIGIQKFLIKNIVIIVSVLFGLLLLVWGVNKFYVFSSESKLLKEKYEDEQKKMLKKEVNNVVNYIDYMKDHTEIRLKSELNNRVNEAIDIARNIYQENIDSKPLSEIEKMVKDALRPIRFFEGRGYFFAFSMDGIETLFADKPEMEGENMLPVQGAKGEFVVRDMIDLVKKQGEGFYQYTWTKPSQRDVGFLKIAYVKYFKPFDWVFGTGEYIDNFTNQIQNMVLERIVNLRFRDEGYFFGSTEGGYPLFTNGVITKGTDHIWEMTDPNGVKVIQEQQSVSKQPDGGFVRYSWSKLGSSTPVPKISYVREIPGWGWTIGAGVYLDTVEKTITKSKDTLKRQLIKKSIAGICVLIGFIVLIWFLAKRVTDKIHETIETFEKSFRNAATDFVTIPTDDMQFSELSRIAKSANKMIAVQKKTEKSLRESEKMHRALVEGMPDIVMRFDRKGRHLFVSDNVRETMDIEPEHFIDKTHAELGFPEETCRFWEESIRRVFDSGAPFETEFTFEGKAGPVIFDWRLIPERDGQGEVSSVLSINRDITSHRKAEQDYQTLFREMLDGFALHEIILDPDGIPVDYRFLAINPSFERMTGLRAQDIVGRTVLEVLPGTERHWIETYGNVALTGDPAHFENYSTELRKHFDVTAFRPVEGQFACIFQDITERIKAEAERERLQAQLTQVQKMESIGNLAGGIAHDFNNILFPIIGMSELLLEDLPPGSGERENAEEILKAGKRGSDLVKQILTFSRRSEHKMMPTRIHNILKEVITLSRSSIPSDIEIKQEIQQDCGMVMADPSQIHQIGMNIITNAYHAVEETGGTIFVKLKQTVLNVTESVQNNLCPGVYAILSISDTGHGMSGELIGKIFDPYFTTKKQGKGTGLGLAVVHGIVNEHGGAIKVQSEIGKGTDFHIYLPLMEKTVGPKIDELTAVDLVGNERILLVDDEEAIAKVEKQMLERLGYQVIIRNSSPDALQTLRSNVDSFDLVITDMTMPNMTGDKLAKEMIALRPDLPIIICTGFSERINQEKAEAFGIKGFLMKPVVKSELAQMVRKVLDESQKS